MQLGVNGKRRGFSFMRGRFFNYKLPRRDLIIAATEKKQILLIMSRTQGDFFLKTSRTDLGIWHEPIAAADKLSGSGARRLQLAVSWKL